MNGVRLVCFELCGEKFAFNMDYLVEIVQTQDSDITPFFSPLPLLRGKWNYREKIIDIIDLRDFFALKESGDIPSGSMLAEELQEEHSEAVQQETDSLTKDSLDVSPVKSILVVRIREQIFGLFADAVLQVVPLGGFYEYPNMISTLPKRYFEGVTVINTELVLILAIGEFITNYELDTLLETAKSKE